MNYHDLVDNMKVKPSDNDSTIKKAIIQHLKDFTIDEITPKHLTNQTVQDFFYHVAFCTIFAVRDIFAPDVSANDEDGCDITDKYVSKFMSVLKDACEM